MLLNRFVINIYTFLIDFFKLKIRFQVMSFTIKPISGIFVKDLDTFSKMVNLYTILRTLM